MQKKINNILIVEDEAIIGMAMAAELEDAGYAVVDIVHTGKEALSIIRQQVIDLVILDIKLGNGMDGLDTLVEIRKLQSPRIFIVSGNSDSYTAERMKNMDIDGFFVKPVNLRALIQRLEIISGPAGS